MGFPVIMKDAYETVMFDDERRAEEKNEARYASQRLAGCVWH